MKRNQTSRRKTGFIGPAIAFVMLACGESSEAAQAERLAETGPTAIRAGEDRPPQALPDTPWDTDRSADEPERPGDALGTPLVPGQVIQPIDLPAHSVSRGCAIWTSPSPASRSSRRSPRCSGPACSGCRASTSDRTGFDTMVRPRSSKDRCSRSARAPSSLAAPPRRAQASPARCRLAARPKCRGLRPSSASRTPSSSRSPRVRSWTPARPRSRPRRTTPCSALRTLTWISSMRPADSRSAGGRRERREFGRSYRFLCTERSGTRSRLAPQSRRAGSTAEER